MAAAQKKHPWVFAMLEADPEGGSDYAVADALPEASPDAQKRALADAKAWLQAQPLSRRPLCKVCSHTPLPCNLQSAARAACWCQARGAPLPVFGTF